MDAEHGKSAESVTPDTANEERPYQPSSGRPPIPGSILVLGALILLVVIVVLVVLHRHRPLPHGSVRGLAELSSSESSPGSEQAAIPLELLFPEDAATSGNGAVSPANVPPSHPGPEAALPIPVTAAEVVSETHQVADELARQFPTDPDGLEIAARTHLWLGDSDAAAAAWQRCLSLDSNYRYAYEGLGILAAKRGEFDEAISQYRRALEGATEAPGMLGTRIRLATVLIDQGQLEEAIKVLGCDAQSQPIAVEVLVLLGMAHLQAKHYAEARQYYEAAISNHPMHANAHFGLATACRRLGDGEAADRHMERFRELRSGERAIRMDQRSQYDDVEEMREHLAKMLENAGRLYHAHKDLAQAEEHWRRAAALDPKAVDCRQAVAWFCQQDGRTEDAIAMLRELALIEPGNPVYLVEVGRLQTMTGRYDEAEATLHELRQRMPACADAQAALARLYLRTGRLPESARELADSAARLEPSPENLLLLAAACERSGRLADAATAMERLASAAPERSDYQRIHQELLKRLNQESTP